MRLEQAKRDHYRKLAREEGYRSRAAYKLLQIASKYQIIREGFKVIDLGCAPGGWLQVASKLVGDRGAVFGVDVTEVKQIDRKNVTILRDDISSNMFRSNLLNAIGKGRADCVLADLSPKLSGIWDMDHFRQIELCHMVVDILQDILATDSSTLMKAFHGSELESLVSRLRGSFERVEISKPEASRNKSSEVYLVSMGFSGQVPSRSTESHSGERRFLELEDSGAYGWHSDRLN